MIISNTSRQIPGIIVEIMAARLPSESFLIYYILLSIHFTLYSVSNYSLFNLTRNTKVDILFRIVSLDDETEFHANFSVNPINQCKTEGWSL
jgi:hypothetical protein